MTLKARGATVTRRLRSAGGQVIRRLGLLPGGTPDGLGEDDQLLGQRLDAEIVVYFPDTTNALYQLEQWYAALRALDRVHKVVVILQDSRTAAHVRRDSGLPCHVIARYGTLDDMLGRSDVRMALYVNHSVLNFAMLRFSSLVHVSLLHGDSDKTVSVSNQTKAYDFTFVAGQAAIDRVRSFITLFDPARCIPVGRPNLDAELLERAASDGSTEAAAPRDVAPDGRPTVLYAPSWEGAQPSAFYGTTASHGRAIVDALVADGRFRVIYRPHPLSGVRLGEYGEADGDVRAAVARAAAADPRAGHRVDEGNPITDSFDAADLLVCDVSAVSMEWLPSGKPLIITEPDQPQVVVARTPLGDVVARLDAAHAGEVAQMAAHELEADPSRAERLALIEHYLGDTTPGASLGHFLTAIDDVLARRDAEWARLQRNGAVGP